MEKPPRRKECEMRLAFKNSIVRPLVALAIVLAALVGQPKDATASSTCGIVCIGICPGTHGERADKCQQNFGGTCGLGSSCLSSGQSLGYCAFFEQAIQCHGGADQ
jgi:hypothetical protein